MNDKAKKWEQPRMDGLKHIRWLADNLGAQVEQRLFEQEAGTSLEEAFQIFLLADPSENKTATDWLVKVFCNGGILWEDIAAGRDSKTYKTLLLFTQNRHKLEKKSKNLSKYKELGEIWAQVKKVAPQLEYQDISQHETKRQLKDKIFRESIILEKSEKRIIAVPLTERASQWWGRGTQWCTSALNHNRFQSYNIKSPLVIAVFPHGLENCNESNGAARKFQLWAGKNTTEAAGHFMLFADENDQTVPIKLVWNNWQQFEPIVRWGIEQTIDMITYLPPNLWTNELAKRVFLETDKEITLFSIPQHMRNQELFYLALERNLLRNLLNDLYFSDEVVTAEMRWRAFQKNANYFILLNAAQRTPEVCKEALRKAPFVFKEFKEKEKTAEICKLAVESQPKLFRFVPEKQQTIEIVDYVLDRIDISHLQHIREDLRSPRVIEKMFARAPGENFKWVPEQHKTWDHCIAAIKDDRNSVSYIPDSLLDENRIESILTEDISTWPYFSKSLTESLDKSLVARAIENSKKGSIQAIPQDYWTTSVLERWVKKNIYWIMHIPREWRTKEIYKSSAREFGGELIIRELQHQPALIDSELIAIIMEKTPEFLLHLPRTHLNEELCIMAIENGATLDSVPSVFLTKKVCEISLSQSPVNALFLPSSLYQTDWILTQAEKYPKIISLLRKNQLSDKQWIGIFNINPEVIKFMPHHLITVDLVKIAAQRLPLLTEGICSEQRDFPADQVGWDCDILQSLRIENTEKNDGLKPDI